MKVVVVGSGIAGVTFAEEMRKQVPETEIVLLTMENRGYYSRPLLSHGFTRDDIESRIILRSFTALGEVMRVISSAEATALEPGRRLVRYRKEGEEGVEYYDFLVLAQGSEAFVPPPFRPRPELYHLLNSLEDLVRLRSRRGEALARLDRVHWAVVGGGLIGCEVAADLAGAGDRVSLFHAMPRLMERQLEVEDSASLWQILKEDLGVRVLLDCAVQGFEQAPMGVTVKLTDGEESGFHAVIVACGFMPRTGLAQAAGLPTARGILVDAFLRTADPNVYAIGDVAQCADDRIYAYVTPVRSQALWLARHLAGRTSDPWQAPVFSPKAKVPGFNAVHPYLF